MHLERSQCGCKHTTLAICTCTNIRNNKEKKNKTIRKLKKTIKKGVLSVWYAVWKRASPYECTSKSQLPKKCNLNDVPLVLSFGIDIPLNYG